MMEILQLLLALGAVVAIIYLSYLASKYLSAGAAKINSAKYMRIVDRMAVGQDRSLLIVQIGDKYYVVGNTPQHVDVLTHLDVNQLVEFPQDSKVMNAETFKNTFEGFMGKKSKDKQGL